MLLRIFFTIGGISIISINSTITPATMREVFKKSSGSPGVGLKSSGLVVDGGTESFPAATGVVSSVVVSSVVVTSAAAVSAVVSSGTVSSSVTETGGSVASSVAVVVSGGSVTSSVVVSGDSLTSAAVVSAGVSAVVSEVSSVTAVSGGVVSSEVASSEVVSSNKASLVSELSSADESIGDSHCHIVSVVSSGSIASIAEAPTERANAAATAKIYI